jgi:hypothetical protein
VSDREEVTVSPVRRGPLRAIFALLVAACLSALTVAPAHAAAYRFWGFYQLENGTWVFAQKGPDQTVPADGSVEGWRYAVGDESSSRFPRATLTFAQVCGSTSAQAGSKRVAVVVDFGRPADSENGSTPPEAKAVCAVVPDKGTSTDVLKAAGALRVEKGLICSVADYPATGCGGEVKQVSAEAKAPDTAITIAAAASPATTGSTAPADAAAATSGNSAGTTTAYVIAGLALLALIAYLVYRSRARAGSDA